MARCSRLLHARLLELETRNSAGTGNIGTLGEIFKSSADSFVVPLPVVATAEILVEQPPQRPEIFPAILAAQKRRLSSCGFHYIGKPP